MPDTTAKPETDGSRRPRRFRPWRQRPAQEPERVERVPLLRTVGASLRLAWEASPAGFVGLTLLSVSSSVLNPVVLWLVRVLINQVAAGAGRAAGPTVLLLGLVVSVQRASSVIAGWRQELFAYRVQMRAEARLFERAARIDLGWFDDPSWHDGFSRAAREAAFRPVQTTIAVVTFSGFAVQLVGMLGLLAALHPVLVLLSSAAVLMSAIHQRRVSRRAYTLNYARTPEERERQYLRELLTSDRAAKEVRAFGLERHLLKRFLDLSEWYRAQLSALYSMGTKSATATAVLGGVLLAAGYWFLAFRAPSESATPGDLFVVYTAFNQVTQLVGNLSAYVVMIQNHGTFLRDYFRFLETPPLLPVRTEPVELPASLDDGIELSDVWFRYPKSDDDALAGVSLCVRPGEMLALVGENGAGKTTIVKLLLRFYDPERGRVRLGGVDLMDADPAAVRSRFGVLFQDFQQYTLSVRENVSLGRPDRPVDDAAIEAALAAGRAHEVVKRLPHGIDSKVGRLFEGGHDLSGGEWQRLAIARLVYRNADIWVLDEPTSSLDPEAEAAIFAELRETLRGRIGIVISHRFSTVRIADKIAVVHDGRITELGSHEELLALEGRYARLFHLQAAGYR